MEWDREDIYDKIIQGGLIGLIIWTPLPKGSVDVQYFSILELAVFSLLAIWCVKVITGGGKENRIRNGGKVYRQKASLFMPVLLLIGFVVFQLMPFPPKVIKVLSPDTYRLYGELLSDYGKGETGNAKRDKSLFNRDDRVRTAIPFLKAPRKWRSLSLYPHNTREYFLKILAYAGAFFLILQTVCTKAQVKRFVYVIIFTGFAIAVLSIIHKYSYNGKALWLWKPVFSNAHPYGPFVNKNHFAGYINLIIPLGIGMAMYEAGKVPEKTKDRLKRLRLFLFEDKGARVSIFAFVSVVMTVALFLALSRGGMLSFAGALLFMALMIALRRSIRKRAVSILLISCTLLLITWFGWDPIIMRLETFKYLAVNPYKEMRMLFWHDTISMFKGYPFYGTGMGTFVNAFPIYKSFKLFLWVWYAENDYLQMLSEGGIIGAGIVASLLVMFFSKTVQRWKTRHDRFVVYVVLGSLVGIVGFLLATIFNFNFHLPANAFLFVVIVGLAYALVNAGSRGQKNNHRPEAISAPLGKKTRFVLYPIMLAVLLILSLQAAKIWAADVYYNKAERVINNRGLSKGLEFVFLDKAIALNPINSEYRDVKARQVLMQASQTSTIIMKKWWSERAINGFEEALSLEPTNGYYWMHLGWTAGFQTDEYRLAWKAYENSVKLNPTNYALHRQYALWAFAMARNDKGISSRLMPSGFGLTLDNKKFLDIGVREYRAATAINPQLIREALWRYSEFTLDAEDLKKIVSPEYDSTPLVEKIISERAKAQETIINRRD